MVAACDPVEIQRNKYLPGVHTYIHTCTSLHNLLNVYGGIWQRREGVSTLWGLHPGKLLSRITTNDAWDSDPLTHAAWLFHCYTFPRTFCLVVSGVSRERSSVVAKLQGYLMSPKLCRGFRLVNRERIFLFCLFVWSFFLGRNGPLQFLDNKRPSQKIYLECVYCRQTDGTASVPEKRIRGQLNLGR